jgi:hypothetical protein
MRTIILVSLLVLVSGCAWLTQAKQDYTTGATTPLAVNEVSPSAQAAPIVATASALPIVGPFAGILGIVLTGFFTWQRGVSIRKNNGVVPAVPASSVNIFTAVLQDAANIAAGLFTTTTGTTTAGSVWQRIWKVALATVASGTAIAAANPSLQTYLLAHPVLSALFVSVTSGIAGLEKALSNVPTLATTTNGTSATVTTT